MECGQSAGLDLRLQDAGTAAGGSVTVANDEKGARTEANTESNLIFFGLCGFEGLKAEPNDFFFDI